MTDSKTLSTHAFVWFSVICQVKHTITYKIVLRVIFFVKDAVVFHQTLFAMCTPTLLGMTQRQEYWLLRQYDGRPVLPSGLRVKSAMTCDESRRIPYRHSRVGGNL